MDAVSNENTHITDKFNISCAVIADLTYTVGHQDCSTVVSYPALQRNRSTDQWQKGTFPTPQLQLPLASLPRAVMVFPFNATNSKRQENMKYVIDASVREHTWMWVLAREKTFSGFFKLIFLCLIWIGAFLRHQFLKLRTCQLLNAASLKELPILLLTSIKCCDTHNHMQILQREVVFFLEF